MITRRKFCKWLGIGVGAAAVPAQAMRMPPALSKTAAAVSMVGPGSPVTVGTGLTLEKIVAANRILREQEGEPTTHFLILPGGEVLDMDKGINQVILDAVFSTDTTTYGRGHD